jgi:hypothetical protein
MLAAALAYDEKKQIQPEALIKGCLRAANLIATKDAQEYLGGPASSQDSVQNASMFLQSSSNTGRDGPNSRKKAETPKLSISFPP